jgi:hypothetical protein
MANTAAYLVDRVLPDVPVRQYVLSLPYELRKLAAFKADVLTALGRIFVESIFARYRARAHREGLEDAQCGAITFVQRFGSLNLNVHFHVLVLDGVVTRDPDRRVVFHPAAAPTPVELEALVERVMNRSVAWLRRHGHVQDTPLEERSNEPPAQTALDACADIAMGRGTVATLSNDDDKSKDDDREARPEGLVGAVERDGFNVHAGVRIEAGDHLGRERLARYGARPPLSLDRLRRLPGGRVGYRLKYVRRGPGKYRIMTGLELMARDVGRGIGLGHVCSGKRAASRSKASAATSLQSCLKPSVRPLTPMRPRKSDSLPCIICISAPTSSNRTKAIRRC